MHHGEEKRLRPKYIVRKIMPNGTESIELWNSTDPEDIDSPFVLMPRKDPAAFAAMLAYAQCCELRLSAEIANWLGEIAAAEPKFGTQGVRNYSSTRAAAVDSI